MAAKGPALVGNSNNPIIRPIVQPIVSSTPSVTVSVPTTPTLTPGVGWVGDTATPSATGNAAHVGYSLPVVAHWTVPLNDVVEKNIDLSTSQRQYTRFVQGNEYHVGLVAHHLSDIYKVYMAVDGGSYQECPLVENPIDGVEEYIGKISLTGMVEGEHEVRAIIVPNSGTPMVIQGRGTTGFDNEDRYGIGVNKVKKSHVFYYRPPVGSTGSTYANRVRYVSVQGNDDSGNGSLLSPYRTIGMALFSLSADHDGAKIFLSEGEHYWDYRKLLNTNGTFVSGLPWYGSSFPMVIESYPGVVGQPTMLDCITTTGGASGHSIDGNGLKIHKLELRNLYCPRVRMNSTAHMWQSVPQFEFPRPDQGGGKEATLTLKNVKGINLLGITHTNDGTDRLRWVWDEAGSRGLPTVEQVDFYSRFVSHVDTWQENQQEAKLPDYLTRKCVVRNSNSSQIYNSPRCCVANYITGIGKDTDGVRWYVRRYGQSNSVAIPNEEHTDTWQFQPFGFVGITGNFGSFTDLRGSNTAITGPASAKWAGNISPEATQFVPYDYLVGLTSGYMIITQNFISVADSQVFFDGASEQITLTGCGPDGLFSGTFNNTRHSIVVDGNTMLRKPQTGTFILLGPAHNGGPFVSSNGGVNGLWPRYRTSKRTNLLWKNNTISNNVPVISSGDPTSPVGGVVGRDQRSDYQGVLFKDNYLVSVVPTTGIGVSGSVEGASGQNDYAQTDSDSFTGGSDEVPFYLWSGDNGYPGYSEGYLNPTYMPFRSANSGIWYQHSGWTGASTPTDPLSVVVSLDEGDAREIGNVLSVSTKIFDQVEGLSGTEEAIAKMDYMNPWTGYRVLEGLSYQWVRVSITGGTSGDSYEIDEPIAGANQFYYSLTGADFNSDVKELYCRVDGVNYRDRLDGRRSRRGNGISRTIIPGVLINDPVAFASSSNWTVNVSTNVTDQFVLGSPSTWVSKTYGGPPTTHPDWSGPQQPTNFSSSCTSNADGVSVKPVWLTFKPVTAVENSYGAPLPWMRVTALTSGSVGTAILQYAGTTGYGGRWYSGTANCEFPSTSLGGGWKVELFEQMPAGSELLF